MAVRHRWKKIPVLQTNTVDRRQRSDLEEGVSALKNRFWNLASLVSNCPLAQGAELLNAVSLQRGDELFPYQSAFFFLAVLDGFRILFPSQGLNPGPKEWKCWVLTTGPLGEFPTVPLNGLRHSWCKLQQQLVYTPYHWTQILYFLLWGIQGKIQINI